MIRRIADQWRPASPVESFAIVRQRLFEEPGADAQADIAAVARVFTDFYARNRAEFPSGVAEPSYEERIKSAYPMHPELFDRLYQRLVDAGPVPADPRRAAADVRGHPRAVASATTRRR